MPKLSLRPSVSLKNTLGHKLQTSHKLALIQALRLASLIETLRASSPDNPATLLAHVIQLLLIRAPRVIADGRVVEALETFLTDEKMQASVLARPDALAYGSAQSIDDFAVRHLAERMTTDGKIALTIPGDEEHHLGRDYETTAGAMYDALRSPEKVEQSTQELLDIAKQADAAVGEGLFREVSEKRSALSIAEHLAPVRETMSHMFTLALRIRDGREQPPLLAFLRDYVILQRMSLQMSQRLIERYAANYRGRRRVRDTDRLATLNTIGEFVLLSMGIITPEMFRLQSAEIDSDLESVAAEVSGESVEDIRALLVKYNLQTSGGIFWNRWAVKGHKSTALTDELVRQFITETVRAASDELLLALEYDTVFVPALQEIMKTAISRDEVHAAIGNALAEAFDTEAFQAVLLKHMRTDWYRALQLFWGKRSAAA